MALLFEDAAKAKDAIMVSQQKEIAKLYDDWANDIAERAKFYSHKTNASAPLSERYYKELYKQMKATGQAVSDEISGIIKSNMYTIADSVVAENVKWLQSFGFSPDGLNAAFSYVPHDVVQMLITGQVYQGGWNLSQRIWSDNQQTQKDIYQVMARGLAEQKSIYDIAKDLESYVRPGAKKSWNPILAMKNTKTGEIEYKRIYKKQVDYNAQRLARTLAQHTYQQSFIATTKDNPFITDYIWHSNGSRVCELCMSRDGVHFKKNELPMDHPNGMCTMEPAVAEDMNDKLVEWFNSPDGTFPEIDEFAGNFGYEAKTVKTAQDFVNKYGMSNKSPNAWFNSLTQVQKAEAKMLKEQSGLGWNEWYEQNVHSTGDPTQDFVKKYGTSTKSPNAWFNGLTPEQKAEAKLLKEQSGLTWNDWYNKNVYAGSKTAATATATKTTAAAASKTVKAFNDVQDKYLSPYGFSPDNMPKNFDDWSHKISYDQAGEILKSMGTSWSDPHPYQQLMKYYNANLTNANFVDKAADATKAVKAASETLSEKDVVKILKSGKWDDINEVSKIFAKHGFDIDTFFDDDLEAFDTDSYMFKEAAKQIFGKNTAAKAATTVTKTTATAAKAASKVDDVAIAFKNKYTQGQLSDFAYKAHIGNEDAIKTIDEFLKVNGIDPNKFKNKWGEYDHPYDTKLFDTIESFYAKYTASADKSDTATWIASFKKQTESHMLDLEKSSMQLIGEAGKRGIKTYSGSSYTEMNSYLRYLQSGFSEDDAIRKSGISSRGLSAVKNAMKGLDNAKLTEDLVLRRGTDLGDLAGAFMSGDFSTNKSSLYGKSAKELNDMFSGAIGTYGSFTSTSSIWDRGFSGTVEVVMYAPKGTSASSIMSISQFGTGEGETLLNAGTTVKCTKIEESDGHKGSSIRVFMEIIPK